MTAVGAHRRRNPLTGRWVLVSEGRTSRPWRGKVDTGTTVDRPQYDPECYLCPGNTRASGETNPPYDGTFVFTNDFPALRPDPLEPAARPSPLFEAEPVAGTCRVICFSPRHDLTLARMAPDELRAVVDVWADQESELGTDYPWVQLFENSGAEMGASIPHPHGQLWATSTLPTEIATEDDHQRRYFEEHRSPLLVDYAAEELEAGDRIVVESEHWLAVVPYWAAWPFETLLMPRTTGLRVSDLDDARRDDLVTSLRALLTRYDNLFETPFPYSLGWHGAPATDDDHSHWQLHAHLYPPLLRSPTIRKHMVGFELLAETQRDLSPESAAERLRSLPVTHYLDARG